MNAGTKRTAMRVSVAAVVTAAAFTAALGQTRSDSSSDRRERDRSSAGSSNRYDRNARPSGFDRSRTSGSSSAVATPSTATPSAAQAAPSSSSRSYPYKPSEYSKQYAVLEQKNIFQRARTKYIPPEERPDESSSLRGPRREEDSLILTGIALQEGRHVAFVENTSTYSTQRLTPGASIGRGKIVAVERDHIEYEANGVKSRIDIGHTLAGSAAAAASAGGGSAGMTVSGSTSASSGTSAGAPIDPNNPNLTVEEKMRLRRQQEQQKK